MLSVSKGVLNLRQWGCKLRRSYHLKKALQLTHRGPEHRKWTGLKHDTDTIGILILSIAVNRRLFCTEVSSREGMERKGMRILVGVGSNFPENGKCRKGKVSSAISISQGLVST